MTSLNTENCLRIARDAAIEAGPVPLEAGTVVAAANAALHAEALVIMSGRELRQ